MVKENTAGVLLCGFHLPKTASNSALLYLSPMKASEGQCACTAPGCALASPASPVAELRTPRRRQPGPFDDFRAAANAVCFALRSANPRAPWQAAALVALFAPASWWRFKHINKAQVSREASVFSSLPLLE